MVDKVFLSKPPQPGVYARLKVGSRKAPDATGLSSPEKNLTDILDLGSAAQDKIWNARKLDAYLRVFSSALKMLNGYFSSGYKPQMSDVSVELVKKPDTKIYSADV